MIKPPLLKPGDKIAIVAPSRKIHIKEIEAALKIFKTWNLEVVLSKNLFSDGHSYLAGTDDERLNDLQSFIDDSSIKAIIAARGGYGSTRIIDSLNFHNINHASKWIVGFSDITALHLKLDASDIVSVHGTMPILFSKEEATQSINSLKQILFHGKFTIENAPHNLNREGSAEGKLIGGNLSLLVDSMGTSSELNTDNAILIIEEIDEYFYRIDRMLTQLKRAGKLKNLRGLVVGHMTDIKESTLAFGETVEQIVLNAVGEYQYPVAFAFPSGHQNPNLAWIHGDVAFLKISRELVSLSSKNVFS